MSTITFEYLADLTQRAWRFAQYEWPELPGEEIPVFELKTKADEKNVGIGYKLADMQGQANDEVVFHVIHEVAVQATLIRNRQASKEDFEKTLKTLIDRINAANAAEAHQATKH